VAKIVVPQGALSISSFEPAATMSGREASIATAGSFCLLRGNGSCGLPIVTSAVVAAIAVAVKINIKATARTIKGQTRFTLVTLSPFVNVHGRGRARISKATSLHADIRIPVTPTKTGEIVYPR